jgi:hypothetical protein
VLLRQALFSLTLEWRTQAPAAWQATLRNQQDLCIGRFVTPLALLEWLEEYTFLPSGRPPDLP